MNNFITAPRDDRPIDDTALSRKYLHLTYPGPGGEARPFDLYLPPEGDGPFPLIISVSGGGWYFGSPSSHHLGATIHTAVNRGYALASIACTSSGKQIFPYQIQELNGALAYLRQNGWRWHVDGAWTALWGASSGGHLALFSALTAGEPAFASPLPAFQGVSTAVQAVVAIYPVCRLGASVEDFAALGLQPEFDRSGPLCADSLFLGQPVEESPALAAYASPISHITPQAPPLLLLHGDADRVVPSSFTLEFAKRFQEIAGPERLAGCHILPGVGHSHPVFKDAAMCHRILDFLDAVRLQPA